MFLPDTSATIETPFIFVAGLLEVSLNGIVDSANIDGLHFIMSGTEDQPFYPETQNELSCPGSYCSVGKKPIVVAGGTLDIQGLKDTCPTWVNLLDVGYADQFLPEDYPTIPIAPQGCDRALINKSFESGEGLFKSSLRSIDSIESEDSNGVTNSHFKVAERNRSWQGAFINVDSFLLDCMIPDQTYLVKARYRLIHEGNSVSQCHIDGTDCIALNLHTMYQDETTSWKTLFETPAIAKSVDGVWTEFVATIKFEGIDFDPTALFQV